MEVKKELTDREFVEDAIDRRNYAHQAIQPVEVDELILAVRTLRLDLAEAREDTARLDWLINYMNHVDDVDTIWDSLPGDSKDVNAEFRAAIDDARGKA